MRHVEGQVRTATWDGEKITIPRRHQKGAPMRDMVRRDFLHTVPGLVMAANAWEASAAQTPTSRAASGIAASVEALVFDTFGTVVDYRITIIAEGTSLVKANGLNGDCAKLSDPLSIVSGPPMCQSLLGEMLLCNPDACYLSIL